MNKPEGRIQQRESSADNKFYIIDHTGMNLKRGVRKQFNDKGVVGLSVDTAVAYYETASVRVLLEVSSGPDSINAPFFRSYNPIPGRNRLRHLVCDEESSDINWISIGNSKTQFVQPCYDSSETRSNLFAFNYKEFPPIVVFSQGQISTSYRTFSGSGVHPVNDVICGTKRYVEEKAFLARAFSKEILGLENAEIFVEPYSWNVGEPKRFNDLFARFKLEERLEHYPELKDKLGYLNKVSEYGHDHRIDYLRGIIGQLFLQEHTLSVSDVGGYIK
jgi:hypothetical protein